VSHLSSQQASQSPKCDPIVTRLTPGQLRLEVFQFPLRPSHYEPLDATVVAAPIGAFPEKLIDQIAMRAMQLRTIEAGRRVVDYMPSN